MRSIILSLCLLVLIGCSPNSLDDFQREGEALCRSLVSDLKKVQTHEDLLKIEPNLKKKFHHLVDLITQAKLYHLKHPDEVPIEAQDHFFSEQMQMELKRIYRIEGGRGIIERAQREALIDLDAFERKINKKD